MPDDSRTVRLFRNGRNQAVRIPVEFELPGNEAVMRRDGDRLVIEPMRHGGLRELLSSWQPLAEEWPDIADPPPRAGRLGTSVIVAAELRYCCAKRGSEALTRRVEQLLGAIEVFGFEVPADLRYGLLRAQLEMEGRVIGGNDLLIAAHALALGAVLVTDNEREFARVPGMISENWLR